MAESKVDNVEEDQAYITSIKNRGNILNSSINPKKKDYTVNKVDESRTTSVYYRLNKIPQSEKRPKTSELNIPKYNLNVSDFTVL